MTSNGGLILVRELDERLGFGKLVEQHLTDPRANNARLSFADLLRQSVYSRLAGYEDVNDAEQLSRDPTFRLIGSEKIWDRGAALPSRLQTFETELLAEEGNFAGLVRVNRELIGKAEGIDSPGSRWSCPGLDISRADLPEAWQRCGHQKTGSAGRASAAYWGSPLAGWYGRGRRGRNSSFRRRCKLW